MKVKEIMTGNVHTCDLNASLAEAAKQMWDNDCGILPVLKDGREVVGVILPVSSSDISGRRDLRHGPEL